MPKQINVLRRFYAFGRNLSETQKISHLIREIKDIYENVGIPIVHTEVIRLKLKSLIKSAKSIISTRKLSTQKQIQTEVDFHRNINSVLEVSAPSTSSFGTRSLRETSSTATFERVASQVSDSLDVMHDNEMIEEEYMADLNEEIADIEEYEPPQKRQRVSSEIIKKINSECSQNASFRVMSTFIKIGIEIAGGNPRDYCVSKSQLQNQISKYRSAEKTKKLDQMLDSESKLILQFDTKSCSNLNKRHLGLKLRLVIILRDETSVITLGPNIINDHGAATCATEIIDVITEYNLFNRIIGIVCDTENVNTGHLTGVCVRIEKFLGIDLLNLMCRHHIYDLILKHVGEFLFGHSTAPTFDFGCLKLKKAWETLNLPHFSPYVDEFEEDFVTRIRENAIQILKMQAGKNQTRDDYCELTDLSLKFFGESNIGAKKFMVPGATNNSRWMAKAIYVIKCYLFRHQIDFEDQVIDKLRRFAFFISAIYVKYWNWCPNVFDAPVNDLSLLKELEKYREIDHEIANVAIETFCRHLTYLSDEMMILSVFSNHLNSDEKEKIRLKLVHAVGPRTENSIRYKYKGENFSSFDLDHFVSNRSMFLLSTLDIDVSFLQQNAREWETFESYHHARNILKNLFVVVNDSSERALGQTSNAINYQKARTENNLQNYLTCKLNN